MPDNITLEYLKLYLNGDIDFEALEERIIPLGFDDEFEYQDLIDLIFIEIAYIYDGLSDEPLFRERLAEAMNCNEYADMMQRSRIAS